MVEPVRWCEIAEQCDRQRYTLLSEALTAHGIDNELHFVEVEQDQFIETATQLMLEFDQIRIGDKFSRLAMNLTAHHPKDLLALQSVDALVKTHDVNGSLWWPRNFLSDGIVRVIAEGQSDLDFSRPVLLTGARSTSRSVIAALAKIGFNKFTICDPQDDLARQFVAEMTRAFFNLDLQMHERMNITQLPSVYAMAANLVKPTEDAEFINELMYFNFLRPNGIWLDLVTMPPNSALEAEAINIGADVRSGIRVAASVDLAWAERCFGVRLDFDQHVEQLLF
jgi:shikimate 5-dehydrogenase